MRKAALALAASAAVIAPPALAQDALDLRGAVAERSISDELFGQPQPDQNVFADEATPERTPERSMRRAVAEDTAVTAATVREPRVDAQDEERNSRATTDNVRTGAIEGRGQASQDDGFSPLGLRLGSFLLRSRLDQGLGWTSNASSSPGGGHSTYSETGVRFDAESDWSRHSASISGDGNWRRSVSGERISEIQGGVNGELRLDLGYDLNGTLSGGYRVRQESASSPSAIAGVDKRPLRHTLSGSAGLSRDVGKVRIGLTGDVARNIYDDASLTDGTVVSQRDRNSTLATAKLRAGYEISPAIRPFVEAEIGRRLFDEELDGAGYARSADRYALRGGVELDLREKLTGEFAAGWLSENPDDDRLNSISGFTASGRLAWSPVRGTIVELSGSTEVEGSTTAGEAGSLLYSGSLAVSRELRADLTGRALVGLELRDYASSNARDTVYSGEASLTWWMNRYLGVTGRARHEIQRSNLPNRDYEATSVYLGMTLQR